MREKQEEKEVEVKFKLNSDIKLVKEKIFRMGGKLIQKNKEKDTYFSAFHKDFLKTKECLRIRKADDYIELTYKGKSTKEMKENGQFWKKETNIPLNITLKEAEYFLTALGCKKLVSVEKKRHKYCIGNQIITLDLVKDAGSFLEIESLARNENVKSALNKNMELAKKLGLKEEDIVTEPYRDIVLKRNNCYFEK